MCSPWDPINVRRIRNRRCVENLPSAIQALETGLLKVASAVLRVEGKDKFDRLANRPVSKNRSISSTIPTQFALFAGLANKIHEHIKSIPALVEHVIMLLFCRCNGSIKFSYKEEVKQVVYRVVLKPHFVQIVVRQTIIDPTFTISVKYVFSNQDEDFLLG